MRLTYRGKIGRLPEAIREQVNMRLRQGEKGRALVDWLNLLPEVRAVLVSEFGGKPVREQNLSEWRKGGYLYWLRVQEAYTMMQRVGTDAAALTDAAKEPVTETLATWVTARYLVGAKSAEGLGDDSVPAWDRMREFCHDVMALRRGEQRAQRLELDWERLEFGRERLSSRPPCDVPTTFRRVFAYGCEGSARAEVRAGLASALPWRAAEKKQRLTIINSQKQFEIY